MTPIIILFKKKVFFWQKCSKKFFRRNFSTRFFLNHKYSSRYVGCACFWWFSTTWDTPYPLWNKEGHPNPGPKRDLWKSRFGPGFGWPSMFQRGYGVSHVVENHQKHAQSTYLDEYLWFKKNLAEKYLLEKVFARSAFYVGGRKTDSVRSFVPLSGKYPPFVKRI